MKILDFKQLFAAFILLALSPTMTSCAQDDELRTVVRDMQKKCPAYKESMGGFESIRYENKTVTMVFIPPDGLLDFDAIRLNDEAIRNNFIIGYASTTSGGTKKLINALAKAKAELCVVFKNSNGDTHTIHFTADDIQNIKFGSKPDTDKFLHIVAKNEKIQTPYMYAEGMIVVDVYYDSKYYTHVISCDESIYDISVMQHNPAEMKEIMIDELYYNNPVISELCKKLKQVQSGLEYKFIGDSSSSSFAVRIEANEL